jgi:putative ABC transport system permease protein
MLKNYLKIALRNLLRHRLFTTINVVGLALGAACCALIGLYIQHELSYDRFHRNPENVFRVMVESTGQEGKSLNSITPRFLSTALAETFPEIESATQFRLMNKTIEYQNKEYPEARVIFSDPAFFEVFTFPSIQGDLSKALAEPNSVVLTKSFARKIFGEENPVGKSFVVRPDFRATPQAEVKVAALMEDMPKNAHFKFDAALPFSLFAPPKDRTGAMTWNWFEMKTYVRLKSQFGRQSIEPKLPDLVQHTGGERDKYKLVLQPLTDIHLATVIPFDDVEQTNPRDLYVFAGIALLVLVIACINYMVLVTARYTQRLKEVGVRKIIGATEPKLISQFLIETALIAALTLPLALGIVEMAHRSFGGLLGKELQIDYLNNQIFLWGNLCVLIFFTIVAGFYPALFFSKINAVAMLKGQGAGVRASARLRKSLVVTQFGVTIALLVCVGTMYEQLRYTRAKDLGYQHDNLLVVKTAGLEKQVGVLKQAALSHSSVSAATLSSWLPGYLTSETIMGHPRGEGTIVTEFVEADCDLLKTFQIQLLEGRDFDCSSPNDTLNVYGSGKVDFSLLPRVSILLNETAVKALGLESPVGKELNYSALQGTVIGVIKDMHNRSLHFPIKPMVIKYSDYAEQLVVAYQPSQEAEVLAHLKTAWEKLTTKSDFTYLFLNDHIRQLYATEEKFMQMTAWFAALAIALSCLGLFGMAVFSIERRTKEIGIRKVLGASASGVVTLLSKDFVKLVLIANLIAWPVAWYAMNKWLQDFAYRIELGWWTFALAGGVALLIALLTVSAQAIRAALANPVEALRYE